LTNTKTNAKSRTNSRKTSSNKKTQSKPKNSSSSAKTTRKQTSKADVSPMAKERYIPTEKEIKLHNEIRLLISLAIMTLLMLSNFGVLSPVGDYISYFMFGLFGFTAYIFPIVLFLGIAFLISNINNPKGVMKFVAGGVLYILVSAMIQLIFVEYNESKSVFEYYSISGANKTGGGFFGAMIEKSLHSVIGLVGTYIVLIFLIIIAMVLITERSFISGVKKSSTVVYETAKEDATRIRKSAKDIAKERAYQKKEKRMDNQIRGVAITKLARPNDQDEDIHEISVADIKDLPGVENPAVYKGHVELDDVANIDEYNVENTYEKSYDKVYKESYEAPYKDEYEGNYGNTPEDEAESTFFEDSEGNYRPKEKVQVSESAKAVMNRKAFVVTPATPGEGVISKAEPSVDGSNTNIASSGDGGSSTSPRSQSSGIRSKKPREYVLPKTTLLNSSQGRNSTTSMSELKETAAKLHTILETFGVNANVVDYAKGPSITRYEIQPETGTRLSKITSLADDIKLNLAATDIRIEPIPGKPTIGIEVPNEVRESVLIKELIESKELKGHSSKIAFAAGKDIAGKVIIGDIAKMPHMLVAGTTGSGKSVFTNSIIMSILFRAKPSEVRLIIVDPKVVEFGVYNGIPHLLQPVVTDAKLASNTLKWAVAEMSERYKRFADLNVRDLKGYNEKVSTLGKDMGLKKLPQIVIVIDELADLMMVAAKEVEESICRLAQLARAAGIHLIIATQRPSVDVVTGLIKANIPSRCALMVSSGVDSRTIIDSNGAEKLLGNGDMLFYPSGYVKPVRLQGAFVSDAEVQRVVDFWKNQTDGNAYDDSIVQYVSNVPASSSVGGQDERDDYFIEAARLVIEKDKASTSMLQRMFKIGFNRAARIMDQLCDLGIVGEEEGTKPRKVLMTMEELEQLINSTNHN